MAVQVGPASSERLQSSRPLLKRLRSFCDRFRTNQTSLFLPNKRRKIELPKMDLVSWTLGNNAVPSDTIIYANPAEPDHQLTKKHIIHVVRRMVAGLRKENGGAYLNEDVVCIHDFNNIFYPVLFQGILGAGGCFTGTNPAYTENELKHHFRESETKYVITSAAHLDRVVTAAHECGIPESRIFVFDYQQTFHFVDAMVKSSRATSPVDSAIGSVPPSPSVAAGSRLMRHRRFTELLECGECKWKVVKGRMRCASARAALFSTSGTSGLPKIAVRTHANLIAESLAIKDRQPKAYQPKRLLCVPFFHAFAAPLGNIAAMRDGIKTYIMPRFSEADFLDAVERFQITETALVPPVIVKWLANLSDRRRQQLQTVRIVWCGGAPMDGEVQDKAISHLLRDDARIVQVWGLTECGWLSTFHYPEKDSTGSVGRALPGYQVKLVDDDDREVQSGRGEIVAKSNAIMQGYLADESATASAFTPDGWYRTGDVGELQDGKIYIVDRKKELIKVRGWQVAPAELEAILLKHENIVDAAVIGITVEPDSGEEIPEAHVVQTEGGHLTEKDVKDHLLQYLAKYKVLDCKVIFAQAIPKSASGKILRKVLRQQHQEAQDA